MIVAKTKIDYNKVVDKILFLSKTYNVGSGGDDVVTVRETVREKEDIGGDNNNKKKAQTKREHHLLA